MQIREVNSGHARSLIAFVGSHVSRCRHFASVRGFIAEEREQRRVDLVRVSPTDVVWAVGDLDTVRSAISRSSRSLAVVTSNGTTRSAVACTARTGMSILGRSPRKSVTHVPMHAYVAYGPLP